MKKTFTVHLDALVVLSLLFIALIGLVVFLQLQVNQLTAENQTLQWQGVEDSLNLSSQAIYIKKLQLHSDAKSE